MPERLVVIGGDAAGMSAASQARRRRGADDLEIVAFERGRYTSYSACGIPYWVSGTVDDVAALVSRTPEAFRRDWDIDVRTRHEVIGIDLDRRTVTARDLEAGRDVVEPFDQLVYATGSVPMRPPIDGIDAAGVYGVQTLDDGAALRAALHDVEDVLVLDRNYSPGHGGVLHQELRAALYGMRGAPPIHGVLAGVGGVNVSPEKIAEWVRTAAASAAEPESVWMR
jgi:NAD(P)H-nitrite reductase large subunit